MGRMLETLKLGEHRRLAPAADKPAPPTPGQDCAVAWEIGSEAPYIEGGGPNKKVEYSPSLQPHPPQLAQPPHAPIEKALGSAGLKVVALTETAPMAVEFEVWPEAAPAPTGIAAEIIAYHQP